MSRAFGKPGIEPRWTHGNKEGIGTAYHSSSQIWFTLWNGIVTEVYYPTVDKPQIRDLQFLITDGDTLFQEEKKHLHHRVEKMHDAGLSYRIINSDPEKRYTITKEIICDPHTSVVLINSKIDGDPKFLRKLKVFLLCAPHLEVGGKSNNGRVLEVAGRKILTAEKDGTYLAVSANVQFTKASCGYVGESDGWTDISRNFDMTYQFDSAEEGNIALTAEVDRKSGNEFTIGVAMGNSMHSAVTRLLQALSTDFPKSKERFAKQWERALDNILPLSEYSSDDGELYRSSYQVLMSHEDKTYEGALVASLSIPWGEVAGDEDRGGYHLVWTRDMYNSATAALAAGNVDLPFRALIYLSVSQLSSGNFAQNFWIDGTPYWQGIQLDEAAFPVILAWRLRSLGALKNFDPYAMIRNAAKFLIVNGPVTGQERWEEASGYSPSTLASNITALICAASFARAEGDGELAEYMEDYADFLESHLESWTVTEKGTLVEGIGRHYIRIRPAGVSDDVPDEGNDEGILHINNISPDCVSEFPAKDIVDAGFLELVRYGIRGADDPLIRDSVKVVDALLKVDTPSGPVWKRYNHDGYGQRQDGSAFQYWGNGRAWPLLTGERAHYELALGKDVTEYVRAMEGFASHTFLLPEQVWDSEDIPEKHMFRGRATGSARPLVWAHAEYIKLLRSVRDGKVFDRIPDVEQRYIQDSPRRRRLEIWKPNRKVRAISKGYTLRIQAYSEFMLHWSVDGWNNTSDTRSIHAGIGLYYVDVDTTSLIGPDIVFTFQWISENRWEGKDYRVRTTGVG